MCGARKIWLWVCRWWSSLQRARGRQLPNTGISTGFDLLIEAACLLMIYKVVDNSSIRVMFMATDLKPLSQAEAVQLDKRVASAVTNHLEQSTRHKKHDGKEHRHSCCCVIGECEWCDPSDRNSSTSIACRSSTQASAQMRAHCLSRRHEHRWHVQTTRNRCQQLQRDSWHHNLELHLEINQVVCR